MIRIGLNAAGRADEVRKAVAERSATSVVALSLHAQDYGDVGAQVEYIEWDDVIQYRTYYRLLREVDKSTLVVIDECMRDTNRHALHYNCARHVLAQTRNRLVFQFLPCVRTSDDIMILIDLATGDRWAKLPWDPDMLGELDVVMKTHDVEFEPIHIPIDDATRRKYERKKRALIDGIGLKDPHTIPRNLYLVTGKSKLDHIDSNTQYVGRNNRFKLTNLVTYPEYAGGESAIFEFDHSKKRMTDYFYKAGSTKSRVLVADSKVDLWYLSRYREWAGEQRAAYERLTP